MQYSGDSSYTRLSVQPAGSLRGHDWEVSIWLSPDGKRLLSTTQTNEDHTVCLWDTVAQKRLKVLEGHQRQVLECAYAHDSKSFATACDDGVVRIWTADGELLMGLPGHGHGARGVAFVSSSLLLTCDNTGIVRLWNLSTRQVLLSQSGSPDQNEPGAQGQQAPLLCIPWLTLLSMDCLPSITHLPVGTCISGIWITSSVHCVGWARLSPVIVSSLPSLLMVRYWHFSAMTFGCEQALSLYQRYDSPFQLPGTFSRPQRSSAFHPMDDIWRLGITMEKLASGTSESRVLLTDFEPTCHSTAGSPL